MQFSSITIAGTAFVSGLEWRALVGPLSISKELKQHSEEAEATLYVLVDKGRARPKVAGFLPEAHRPDVPRRAKSLPVALSGVPGIASTCVFVQNDGELSTIAALLDGVPVPGFDGTGSSAEILDAARAFIDACPAEVAVYGNSVLEESKPLTLDEIARKSKTLKKAGLTSQSRQTLKQLGVILLVIGLGVGAKYGYDYQARLTSLAAEKLALSNPEEEYSQHTAGLFKAVIPLQSAVREIRSQIGPSPVFIGGWAMSEVTCTKDHCIYMWVNESGTNKTFVVPTAALELKYSPQGDRITYKLKHPKPLTPGVVLKTVPTENEHVRNVIGELQRYADLGISRNFGGTPKAWGMPPGMFKAPKNQIKEGDFSLSGPWYTVGVIDKLPDAVAFTSLTIKIAPNKTITYKLVGKFYVK